MKDKNLPDDNNSKSLDELTKEISSIVEKLEKKNLVSEEKILALIPILSANTVTDTEFRSHTKRPCPFIREVRVPFPFNVHS